MHKISLAMVTVVTMAIAVRAEFSCEQTGNFLDVHSNCTAYFNCRPAVDGSPTLTRTQFHCDYGMLYSKEEERCLTASNLMCREMDDGTTDSYPVVTTPTTPQTPTQTTVTGGDDDDFECEAVGRYPSKTPGCKKYINCKRQNGVLVKDEETCPNTSLFNPALAQCVREGEYLCENPSTETTPEPGTGETTVPTTDGHYYLLLLNRISIQIK